jgi:hypothetical protein
MNRLSLCFDCLVGLTYCYLLCAGCPRLYFTGVIYTTGECVVHESIRTNE